MLERLSRYTCTDVRRSAYQLGRSVQHIVTPRRWQRWCGALLGSAVAVLLLITASADKAALLQFCDRKATVSLPDLFSYSQLLMFACGAVAVGQRDRTSCDLLFALVLQFACTCLDSFDGWAARDVCKYTDEGSQNGTIPWGHWLDHKVVDNIGELYGCVIAMASWPEYSAYWNLVLLRQAFTTSQDAVPRACGYPVYGDQSQHLCLLGCVNWHYSIVCVFRVLNDVVADFELKLHTTKQRSIVDLHESRLVTEDNKPPPSLIPRLPMPVQTILLGFLGLHFLLWHNTSCGKPRDCGVQPVPCLTKDGSVVIS